ncbi:hypothetical protein BsWGS_03954 [Bradybaena similaris]
MDFLKALEKAKELGLSKDEFLPIYMQEIKNKTDQLVSQNSGQESWFNSDDKASSVWSSASRPGSTWPEWKSQHRDVHKQQEKTAENIFDLKVYLDNMKESLYTQLQDIKYENTLESDGLKSIQEDMKNFLTQIHTDIQALLPASQDGGSQKPDKKDEMSYNMFNWVLEKLNECMLAMKQNIEHSQGEIVTKLYCMQSNLKSDYLMQVTKQEELSLLQGTHITDNFNRGQQTIQQCQSELSTSIKELQSLVVNNFSKICELQDIFGSAMYRQTNNQQLLLTNVATVCAAVTENSSLVKKLKDGHEDTQRQQLKQNLDLPVQAGVNELGLNHHKDIESIARQTLVANEDPDNLLDNKIISVFESSAPSSNSIISAIYDFCIQNVSKFLKARKDFQKVTYDEKLGCCLRASIYFSENKETENVLHVCLDVCQVGQDVVLPDLLRTLSEITLTNKSSDFSYSKVAEEHGVFYLPEIRKHGWFEVCAAFLDLQSSEFQDFVRDGTLSFYYMITVFNRETDRKQEPRCHFPRGLSDHSCENNCADSKYSYDSDSEYSNDSEYFDADAEENKETTRRKSSDTFGASKRVVDESKLQPTTEEETTDPFTIRTPYSTYFLPICGISALIGSESVVDSQDWYLHFLGHSVHALLAFVDDDTMVVCIDHFHGKCCADLPEVAIYRCRVSLLDQTNRMEDLVIGDSMQVFDLTKNTAADWMENCVCIFSCRTIEDRFKSNGRIVLQFDFFDMV